MAAGGHFGYPKIISIEFLAISDRYRTLFLDFFLLTKWTPAAILDGTTMSIIELVRDIWMSKASLKNVV